MPIFIGVPESNSSSSGVSFTALTITLPSGVGVLDYNVDVVDSTVLPANNIIVQPAAGVDTDENNAEMLNIDTIATVAGTGTFNLNITFTELTSGPIKLIYFKG